MSMTSTSAAMKNDSNPETKGKLKETVKKVISSQKADSIVIRELKNLYSTRLLPIEKQYLFAKLHYPEILDSEMSAKPTVLLVGQYSTGKTSFIKNLLGMDYPDIHIGPEPTTDRFIAVVHGDEMKTIKGNALTGVSDLPFAGLSVFGSGFLNKFEAAVVPAPLLKGLNIIDTPGVLSGEKQRMSRGYDFARVSRWFAERSDLILLMFDPSKLDISDEFKSVIEELQPHEDKVHCVLNKADMLDTESLMRVYGALLWSMGKVFRGAEVSRVYVGSFHDKPIAREEHTALFSKDREVLLNRLKDLPKACAMRKVNEMVKRIRLAIVNVCVLGHLRSKMPYFAGKERMQGYLIDNMEQVFDAVRRKYDLAEGDFPKIDEFKAALRLADFSTFPYTKREVLVSLQDMLTVDIPRIIAHVAGVVKEGPGSHVDDADDSDALEGSNKQPRLFTMPEINTTTLSIGVVAALCFSLFVLLILAIFIFSLREDTLTRYKETSLSMMDIIRGGEL